MPAPVAPTQTPEWIPDEADLSDLLSIDTTGQQYERGKEPDSNLVENGFLYGMPMPANVFNWLLHYICAWIAYLNKVISAGVVPYHRTATSYTTNGEVYIGVTDTTSLRTITLSTADIEQGSTTQARVFRIKDESGQAGTAGQHITITCEDGQTIDGFYFAYITTNYGVLFVYSNGTSCFIG